MQYQLTEKQVALKESSVCYLEGGAVSSSAPILFLHGWSISIEPYQESLNILCQHYWVIAPDLPGFGKSTSSKSTQDYSDYTNCLISFIKALEIEKFHLIGHSFGGAIAITLAASIPFSIKSLILVGSTGIPLGSLPEVFIRRLIEIPAQMRIEPKLPIQVAQAFLDNCLFRTENVIQAARLSLEQDLRPLLPQIKSPTLVLWGANDLLTPLKLGQELYQGIKSSQMIVVEEYHEWNIFYPEKFATIVLNFINEREYPICLQCG